MIQTQPSNTLAPEQSRRLVYELMHRAEEHLTIADTTGTAYVHEDPRLAALLPERDYFGHPYVTVECVALRLMMDDLIRIHRPMKVISPLEGVVHINADRGAPEATLVMTALDGRRACRAFLGVRDVELPSREFGTLVAVYPGARPGNRLPAFGEAVAAGMLEQSLGDQIVWMRGAAIDRREPLEGTPIVCVDTSMKHVSTFWQRRLEGAQLPYTDPGSATARHRAVIRGAVSASLEWTSDANIPLAVTYPLVRAAGGDIFTLGSGSIPELRSIGPEPYEEFHFQAQFDDAVVAGAKEPHEPIIVARTRADAEALVVRLFG